MRNPIHRHARNDQFYYSDAQGRITAQKQLERIASLAIPPAWSDVRIAQGSRAKIQATGIDSAGRRQYIYSAAHTARQAALKFDRILSFAEQLPRLRKQVEKDLSRRRYDQRKVVACAVSLMDEAYFRVGNAAYAKEHHSYGLTTLRSKHISFDGSTVLFDFVGKSGQQQHKEITDKQIAGIIKKLDAMPGYQIFRYYDKAGELHDLTSSDVNAYIKDIMGDDYSAKDFRTWGGTLLACIELAKLARPRNKTERLKCITTCVKQVSEKLGNTPAIARSSYIDPRILRMFEQSDSLAEVYETVASMKPKRYLNSEEQCVVRILSQ